MPSIFDKWNQTIDTDGLQKDIKEAEQSSGDGNYKEVPVGKYEVKIEKMEIKESSKGKPMFFCQFRILSGEYKNSCLFMNQVITQGFQVGDVNKFLRSLDSSKDIEFKNYSQYNDLIMDVMEEIDGKLEYLLDYTRSKKDFPIYTIKEVFDAE